MLRHRIIPSLLLASGRLVKGSSYSADRDAGSPGTTARAHNAQGADELMILDIAASREHRGPDLAAVAEIVSAAQIPLTVGGGVCSEQIAADCFNAGADKICLTSVVMDDPGLIDRLARIYGNQAIVVGVDVVTKDSRRRLYDHRSRTAVETRDWCEWLKEAVERGAGEIRLSAVEREGSRLGFDLGLFAAARSAVMVPLILEGGAGTLDHLAEAMRAGADSLALGTMLVFSDNNIVKLKRYLAGAGFPMRG